jgi:hypothetical protein
MLTRISNSSFTDTASAMPYGMAQEVSAVSGILSWSSAVRV